MKIEIHVILARQVKYVSDSDVLTSPGSQETRSQVHIVHGIV